VLNIRLGPEPGANLQSNLAAAISTSAPELSFEFRPMAEQVAARLVRERMVAMLSGFFGVLALALAGLGLYGVVSYGASRRQVEIGIRLALGAKPGSVVWLVGGRVAWLIGGGILLGGIVSWWAARFASALLFGLKATDPFTFVMAGGVLMLVGVIAAVVPAWRASKTDAASVLRQS
jgi:ABC-type antimicrobial peptide transport system permease subunit